MISTSVLLNLMKEGRGRSRNGGSFLLSKTQDNWYFELYSLLENGISLFQDAGYHGNTLVNKKMLPTCVLLLFGTVVVFQLRWRWKKTS